MVSILGIDGCLSGRGDHRFPILTFLPYMLEQHLKLSRATSRNAGCARERADLFARGNTRNCATDASKPEAAVGSGRDRIRSEGILVQSEPGKVATRADAPNSKTVRKPEVAIRTRCDCPTPSEILGLGYRKFCNGPPCAQYISLKAKWGREKTRKLQIWHNTRKQKNTELSDVQITANGPG
jgi:hypothetical protein